MKKKLKDLKTGERFLYLGEVYSKNSRADVRSKEKFFICTKIKKAFGMYIFSASLEVEPCE